jgi:hypothetical protein
MTTPSISNHVNSITRKKNSMYLPSSHVETPVCDRNPEAGDKNFTNISEILRIIGKRGERRGHTLRHNQTLMI